MIVRLYTRESDTLNLLHRVTEHQALPESWRDYFRPQLEKGQQ